MWDIKQRKARVYISLRGAHGPCHVHARVSLAVSENTFYSIQQQHHTTNTDSDRSDHRQLAQMMQLASSGPLVRFLNLVWALVLVCSSFLLHD